MSDPVLAVLTVAPPAALAWTLVASGAVKVRDRRVLTTALRAHAVLAPAAQRLVTRTLPALEAGLGALLFVGVVLAALGGTLSVLLGAGLATAVLGAAFVGYQFTALRRVRSRPSGPRIVPCGCGRGAALGPASVLRAGAVVAGAAPAVAGALGHWTADAVGASVFGICAAAVAAGSYRLANRALGGAGRPVPG